MRILAIIILALLPFVFYYDYHKERQESYVYYNEMNTYIVDETTNVIVGRLRDTYNVCNNFLTRNGVSDSNLELLKKLLYWRFDTITVFNKHKKFVASSNPLNNGKNFDELTIATGSHNIINASEPYMVSIDGERVVFVDISFSIDNGDYVLLRLNTNSIQIPFQSNSYTFIIDINSNKPVRTVVDDNVEYRRVSGPERYMHSEYTSIEHQITPIIADDSKVMSNIPAGILEMIASGDYNNSDYIYSYKDLNDCDWRILQVTVPFVSHNYVTFLIYCLCAVSTVIVFYTVRHNEKQAKAILQILDKNKEINAQKPVISVGSADQIRKLAIQEEKQRIVRDIDNPIASIHTNCEKVEDKIYELYARVEENSLKVLLFYFVVRNILGSCVSDIEDIRLSVDNQRILDEFRHYIENEESIHINPELLTKERLERLLEMFKSDIEYLSMFIQDDRVRISERVRDIVSGIMNVQSLAAAIKPHLSMVFNKSQQVYDILQDMKK